MTPLQDRLLIMLTWLDKYIRDHGLTYYAVGGTMIGAARHKGFIPWDDDIDIAMPRNDYEKLCVLLEHPVDHYVVESTSSAADDFVYTFAKFYDTSTSMTELLNKKVKRGVYIDIFPIDGIGNTLDESYKNYKKIDHKNMFLMTRTCVYRNDRKLYKNLAIFISKLIPSFLINEKKLALQIDRLNQEHQYDSSTFVSITMSTYRARDIHRKELFGTPVEMPFENILVLAPEHYDEYLTEVYGNWRQLPPIEKRKSAHDFIDLDLNKPYM